MLFHFLAFCRWWRLIFLSHPRSSGSASSTSLTLTAACRWPCFFLVRFAQFCELYCPFSFMFHASCSMSHVSCLTRGWYSCLYDYPAPLCFCLTPLGFCSYFSFELCRGGYSCSMLFHCILPLLEAYLLPAKKLWYRLLNVSRHCQRPAGGPALFW